MYLFNNQGQDSGEAKTNIEVVLHHEELLTGEEGADSDQEHVGPGDAGLGVAGGEPLLWEDEAPHRGLLHRPDAGRVVDEVPLHVGGGD